MIKNKNTNQFYIGQSIDIERRWQEHLKGYDAEHSYIDKAILKHGKDNFELIILEILDNNKDILNDMEQYYIKKFNTYENTFHYNLTIGGDVSPMSNPKVAEKISQSQMGKNNSFYGHKHTEEQKRKWSQERKGRIGLKKEKHPFYGKKRPEHSKKMSGKNNPNYGKGYKICGDNHPQSKYTLWNLDFCQYHKGIMYRKNRQPNPTKCFELRYKGHRVPIGGFHDFLTPQIIGELIK